PRTKLTGSRVQDDRLLLRLPCVPGRGASRSHLRAGHRGRAADPVRSPAGMIRDVLAARLAALASSNTTPDYQLLARAVLGIRGAPAVLARRLIEQALVVEDRRDHWRRIGEPVRADAPHAAGVYVFRDADERALYVGKAANLRRRLHAHFADRRWRTL